MIEVNLLPEQLRRQKKISLKLDVEALGNFKFIALGVIAGFLIFIVLIFSIGSAIRTKQILSLIAEENSISSQKAQVELVNKEISILKAKMAALDETTKRKFLWAQKMNELSDLVLPGIWFTRVYTDSEKTLIVEGSVISKHEEAMAAVGKFMKNVREHTSFFKDFSNIKLESVQRKGTDESDIVDFKIALYFI